MVLSVDVFPIECIFSMFLKPFWLEGGEGANMTKLNVWIFVDFEPL